jgi:serine/threonine protein kinase
MNYRVGTKSMEDFETRQAEDVTLRLNAGSRAVPEIEGNQIDQSDLFIPGSLFLGKYNIHSRIGSGGMGVVYRCSQILMGKDMAIKTLNQSSINDEAVQRFQTEAKAAGSLNHPNLVSVYDFGVTESGTPYMVMDFVPGKTLQDVLSAQGQMPLETVIDIFIQCADGLAHAHRNGVFHRDIKPSNIVLLQEENIGPGSIRILDFGIAKITSNSAQTQELTRTGMVIGSPLYMSPEQSIGRKMDARTDIYSLGCVLFECLCGAPPFQGETAIETLMLHQTETPRTLREASMGRDFPLRLQELVSAMMEKNVDNRVDSMSAVHHSLVRIRDLMESPDSSNKATPEKSNKDAKASKGGEEKTYRASLASIKTKLMSTPAFISAVVIAVIGISTFMISLLSPQQQPKPMPKIALMDGRHATDKEIQEAYDEKIRKALREARGRGQDLVHVPACEFSQSQFEILGSEKWIRKLELVECSGITARGLDTILKNPIEALEIRGFILGDGGSGLSDECLKAIARCGTLRTLRLPRCSNISPKGLMEIARMKNLTSLDITGAPVSDDVLKAIVENMHDCSDLNISENPLIGDNSMRIIGMHKKPIDLNISYTSVSDDGLNYLGKNVHGLQLIGNHRVTDKGIETLITKCPNLWVIQLPGTAVTAKGILQLTKLKSLQDLEIGRLNTDAATRNKIRRVFGAGKVNTFKF